MPATNATDPMIGQVLDGRYRIINLLGEGGMGEVYAAEHVHIEKRVAVKLLRNEIVTNAEAVTRFRQEARSASSIGHKNIIAIEDFGTLRDGRIYLCMELLDGAPLSDLIKQPMAPERLVDILIQTGHGLAAAHQKGIIHRDMKPENIFVTRGEDGRDVPKLLDFGIAKVAGGEGQNHLTRTGTIFGTPFYMSPEQALGQNVDHRADVYAMGVIMFEMFCGEVPFTGESFMGILTQHITAEPPSPAQVAAQSGRPIPPGIDAIILRAMKKDVAERYQSMDELVQALVAVYRQISGPGMSSYMDAHVPAPSAAYQAPDASSPGAIPPQSAAYGAVPQSQMYAAPSAGMSAIGMPQKKSKVGLIAALFIVLAVLGGGGTLLVLSMQGGDEAAKKGPDDDKTDPVVVHDNNDDGEQTAAITPDAQPMAAVPADAATTTEQVVTEKPDARPRPVTVLLGSRPRRAVIFRDGKRIGKTPEIIKVVPGKPMKLVIKRRGYRDEAVTIDGTDDEIMINLDRRNTGGSNTGGSNTGGGANEEPDKPDDKPENKPGGKKDGKCDFTAGDPDCLM